MPVNFSSYYYLVIEIDTFTSDMVRAYLRKLQRSNGLALSGAFSHAGDWYSWGACGEYGDPPYGALIIELGKDYENMASFRFWHAKPRDDDSVYRGKVVMYDEIEEKGVAKND